MHVAHKSILGEERRQSPPYPHRPSLYPLTPAPQNNSAFNNTPQHRARQCVTARCSPYPCCCYMSISGTPSPPPPAHPQCAAVSRPPAAVHTAIIQDNALERPARLSKGSAVRSGIALGLPVYCVTCHKSNRIPPLASASCLRPYIYR